MIAPSIRNWFNILKRTPLHPQWLIFKNSSAQKRQLAEKIQGRLLDIGCGNKPLSPFLNPGVEYIGLDYPPTVTKGYSGKADVFGDGQHLPFKSNSFDYVTVLDVMEHLPWPEAAFSEMVRVVKPGGRIITQTPFLYPLHDLPHDFQRWTHEGLMRFSERHPVSLSVITHHGKPLETAALLTNLALAKGTLESLQSKRLSSVLLPLVILSFPIINLSGWLLAKLLPDQGFMPLGYTAVFQKNQTQLIGPTDL
jgi:SAM-dependent methyltransferase